MWNAEGISRWSIQGITVGFGDSSETLRFPKFGDGESDRDIRFGRAEAEDGCTMLIG
jgi:hypothetical protein